MGILRAIGKPIVSIILCICIALTVLSFSFAQITSESFMKPVFKDIILSQMNGSNSLEDNYPSILKSCEGKGSIDFPMDKDILKLNCSDIKSAGKDGIAGVFADAVFKKVYYSSCSGLDCLKSREGIPPFLTSGFSLFLKSIRIYFIIISAVFAFLLVLLAKGISGKFTSLGYCFAASGLPYFILPSIAKNMNMPGAGLLIQGFISVISKNFLILLVTGVVLFAVGIILKIALKSKGKKKNKKK